MIKMTWRKKKIVSVYDELGLIPQKWLSIYKNGKGEISANGVGHAGYSREGFPFNHYDENLLLIIEAEDENILWQIHDLFKKVIFHLPTDIQKAKRNIRRTST